MPFPLESMTWADFVKKVKGESPPHTFKGRLSLIRDVKTFFESNKGKSFNNLSEGERKCIAGLPKKIQATVNYNYDCGWFGSMRGAGKFANRISKNDKNISDALDKIPLTGPVTKGNYDDFIKTYRKTFLTGNWIATSTRLLAMKRPDTFVCFNSKNSAKLCAALGIKVYGMNYARYWDDIVTRIRLAKFLQPPKPTIKEKDEGAIWEARVAFLDSLCYEA